MAKTTSVARRIQANRRLERDGATPDDVERATGWLGAVFSAYPGIVAESSGVRAQADGFVVTCVFGAGELGRAAALAVGFIADRVGARAATDASTTRVRCSATQFVRFQQILYYASELQVGRRPKARLTDAPLPTLLGRALSAFAHHYDAARGEDRSIPQLGVWANALRVVGPEGIDQRELGRRAVISKRLAEVVVSRLERRGRVSVEALAVPGKRGKARHVRLTADGSAATTSAAHLVDTVQEDWRQRFGNDDIVGLRDALALVVDRLPFELPHYVTGYGAADSSVTGGDYVAADPGPPRIPAHGQDWPVVIRKPDSAAADLPLPALLSQVLAAFAIDYERERLGHLQDVSNFLRFVGDEGVPLARAQVLGGVSGNGKTAHERHVDVVVEPRRARDRSPQPGSAPAAERRAGATPLARKDRRVYLTPKGRRMRDAYPHLVAEIEREWCAEYGDAVSAIRSLVTTMTEHFGDDLPDLPDYPDTNGWIHRLWFD